MCGNFDPIGQHFERIVQNLDRIGTIFDRICEVFVRIGSSVDQSDKILTEGVKILILFLLIKSAQHDPVFQ